MNRYGFGSKEVIAFIAVVGVSLLVVGLLYNDISSDNKNLLGDTTKPFSTSSNSSNPNNIKGISASNYNELEDIIAEKSIPYFDINSNNTVSLLTLIQNNYIDTVYSIDKDKVDCTGYVEYNHSNRSAKTYLMCKDKYTTNGYDISKEINY